MNVVTLTLGEYQTNCYLISDDCGKTAVIDPGYEPETVLAKTRELQLSIGAILLTHGHFDHVGAVRPLAEAIRCPVWLHKNELRLPPFLTAGKLYYTDTYAEGDTVSVGGLTFMVIETPGHTSGSVCLRCGETLFSGDTLFAGSCGRVDLGGSRPDMRQSLARLAAIPENLTVLPGHGPATTLDREREFCPWFI